MPTAGAPTTPSIQYPPYHPCVVGTQCTQPGSRTSRRLPVAADLSASTRTARPAPQAASRVQWFFIGALTFAAAIILANKIGTQAPVSTWLVSPAASTYGNGTMAFEQGKGRGRRERWARLSMGRMGASSSFFLRSRRRSIKKQAAKAATRSVVLIGSHFGLGNELLKRLFGDLVSLAARRPLGI